jgi:hypothetical protein
VSCSFNHRLTTVSAWLSVLNLWPFRRRFISFQRRSKSWETKHDDVETAVKRLKKMALISSGRNEETESHLLQRKKMHTVFYSLDSISH